VVAPGHVPTYSDEPVDPRLGEFELTLEASDLAERDPELVLRGRVVDSRGDPVARAVLEPFARRIGEHGKMFGALEGVDPLAVTDAQGEFALGVSEPGEVLLLRVEARALAPRMSPWLAAGADAPAIALTRGATVTGQVLEDGKPLAGVALGLMQQDRDAESWLGERTIATDPSGRFTLVNVPPDQAFFLYGKMESLRPHGALAIRPLAVGADETTTDAGVLAPEKGLRLSGRVVLSDGQPVPPETHVLIDRENAWDTQVVVAGTDGSFVFEGLPAELYSLSTRVRGYRISEENASFDPLNRIGLLGRIDQDLSGLVLQLDPGALQMTTVSSDADEGERYMLLEKSPLRGAEER
jgi:hypothetical protein